MANPPKRPGTMSDTARAYAGRRHRTNPLGIEIEPESTPPPQEPPEPASLDGYDSIPPPIARQLDMLASGLGDVTAAIGRVWDAREGGSQLKRIEDNLATLAASATKHETMLDEFVMPAIKDLMKAVDGVASQLPKLAAAVETTGRLMTTVDDRLRELEVSVRLINERHDSSTKDIVAQLAEHKRLHSAADARLDALERVNRDREVVTKALAKSERRKAGGIGAAAAAVVSALAAAISHFVK